MLAGSAGAQAQPLVPDLGFESDEWLARAAAAASELELGMLAGYRLTRVVARGSQGTVYEAVEPRTNRRVAIKRLPSPQPSEHESARFALETGALAALSALAHPHIVTLLAAPEVDHARLLVMEWVDGAALDTWADTVWATHARRDAVRVIVECISRVATAMAAAHALGLVHRDLKPSNVLVSRDNTPTVLDFGIAKSLVGDAQLTRTDAFTGTPAWAAPEQIGGAHTGMPDARVDVHGLGLLLYRALTGRCAVDTSLPLAPLFHAITTQVPAPPASIRPCIPRALGAVALKALEKDPARRYQTADALHQDLERFLAGEPVQAHPPRLGYILHTLARRHKALAGALAVTLLAVIGGAVTTTFFAIDAYAARAEALARAEQATAASVRAVRMNDFFRGLLARLREREAAGERASARDILALAAASLEAEPHPPESEGALRETLALAFYEIGDYQASAAQYALAINAQQLATPADHAEHGRLLVLLARSQHRMADYARAAGSAREALAEYATADAPDAVRAHACEVLAMACLALQSLDESRAAIDESIARATNAGDTHQLAISVCTESLLLLEEGQPAEASARAKEAVALMSRVPAATVAERARVLHNAGFLCASNGQHDEAIHYLRASLALREAEYAPGHPILNLARSALCRSLRFTGRPREAVEIMERAVAEFTGTHASPNFDTANLRRNLAFAYLARGEPGDAERAVLAARMSLEEFSAVGSLMSTQGNSSARVLLRATHAASGPDAVAALVRDPQSSLSAAALTPAEARWLRAVLLREHFAGDRDRRVPVDERMIATLRTDLADATADAQPGNPSATRAPDVIELALVLSEALLATHNTAQQDEGRQLARQIAGAAHARYGGNSPAARRVQALAD